MARGAGGATSGRRCRRRPFWGIFDDFRWGWLDGIGHFSHAATQQEEQREFHPVTVILTFLFRKGLNRSSSPGSRPMTTMRPSVRCRLATELFSATSFKGSSTIVTISDMMEYFHG